MTKQECKDIRECQYFKSLVLKIRYQEALRGDAAEHRYLAERESQAHTPDKTSTDIILAAAKRIAATGH
jgi:hypothetical protein